MYLMAGLDIMRYPHDPLLPRVWELRMSVTAHDAVYLALAEVLEAPLLTLDRRLARVRGHGARVEVPGRAAATSPWRSRSGADRRRP